MAFFRCAAALKRRVVVAIPAKDEADRIGACLTALDRQTLLPDMVVLLLNNCTDTTAAEVQALAPRLAFRLMVLTRCVPPARAMAGYAGRLVMASAARYAGPDGVVLTTDADAVPPPAWVARNLAAIEQGADIVCGRAAIDPVKARLIPDHLRADDPLECALIGLLDDLVWALDPEPWDPPPRHAEASGASLAVTAAALQAVGGVPNVSCGEDRALVRAVWLHDGRVRRDPDIVVTVSGRLDGRASGGMAETIRRRRAFPAALSGQSRSVGLCHQRL